MQVISTSLPEVLVIEPKIFGDSRGFFLESWNQARWQDGGVAANFVQDNHSRSAQGVLRGLHYQIKQPQGKLVRVTEGEVFDVAVDLRRSSERFGQWVGVHLSAQNHRQLWVPPGFAHGFYVLSESADFQYKCTEYYAPEHERSLQWNDPAVGVEWPLINGSQPLLSKKDSDCPPLAELEGVHMNVWVTGGASGQLHHELLRTRPDSMTLLGGSETRIDICNPDSVMGFVRRERPACIVNAAAHTAVDAVESDPDAAYAVNDAAVGNLIEAAEAVNAHLLHVSTDFVFGHSDGSPFGPDAATDPVSVYGKSKLAGERRLISAMPQRALIMRTAWVYSSHGNNFVKTMLRLMKERGEVGVIADQVGAPTWANSLARALWRAAERRVFGIAHWTGAELLVGMTSPLLSLTRPWRWVCLIVSRS